MENNLDYMIIGYVVGLGVMLLTAGSVWWRYRSLAADEAALATLETDIQAEEGHPPSVQGGVTASDA